MLHSNMDHALTAALGEQQVAPILDRGLGGLRKSLQQPGQRHFHPHMIVRDIDQT